MCGIFGTISEYEKDLHAFRKLAIRSQRRGSDSSGLIFFQHKRYFIERADFKIKNLLASSKLDRPNFIMGHSRLITDGESDNQPIFRDGLALIHNGIIVDPDKYWENSQIKRLFEIDSEVISAIAMKEIKNDSNFNDFHIKVSNECYGSFSCALLIKEHGKLVLTSNTGSLFFGTKDNSFFFASEKDFLHSINIKDIGQILGTKVLDVPSSDQDFVTNDIRVRRNKLIPNLSRDLEKEKKLIYPKPDLKRCTKCILPETMPFITFNDQGVCNYCENYVIRNKPRPKNELKGMLEKYSSISGNKCIVPFSGGRDSSYMLHLITKEFGMNPITMTYDWGMVTDLARRNISRMCASLGVENILIADNIEKKRRNIRLNLKAWLKKPNLGMLNILMAGDKHFFRHIETIRKETDISLNIWGMNPLEVTHFKAGFLGFPPDFAMDQVFMTGLSGQLRYQLLRAKEMVINPGYLNVSLWDTISGEYHRSVKKQTDFYNLFDFWSWDEEIIDSTLQEYQWEKAIDTDSTWRIGDGTAAFYNYVYYTLAGFSEFDTFRSNQIREGQLERQAALRLVEEENSPRFENIKWYLDTLNMDFESVIKVINNAPRKY